MGNRNILRVAALLLVFSSLAGAANIVLLLDASGSMRESLPDGAKKIDVAKAAAKDLLDAVNSGDSVALIVFYDCNKIITESEFTTSHAALKQKIDSVQPSSSTPIAGALAFAKGYVNKSGVGSATIIMLTDGEETCYGDPVLQSRNAYSSGYAKGIQVVGFDIKANSSAEKKLIEVAAAGGGKYYPAGSEKELKDSFRQAYREGTDAGGAYCFAGAGLLLLGAAAFFRSS